MMSSTLVSESEVGGKKTRPVVRPAELVAVVGVCVALVYIFQRRCQLHDFEFCLVAAYLALILYFVTCVRHDRSQGAHGPFYETFSSSSSDVSSPPSSSSTRASLRVLYDMPGKVRGVIAPKLGNLARTFRGEDYDGDEFMRIHEGNALVIPPLPERSSSSTAADLDPRLKATLLDYKRVDYVLCRLKQADEEAYEAMLDMRWTTSEEAPPGDV